MLQLPTYRDVLQAHIQNHYDQCREKAHAVDALYGELIDDIHTLMARGGKRLRPYLFYLTYKGWGGRQDAAVLDVAVALEYLHTFLLIHDDIIDNDVMRYGGLNIEGIYTEKLSQLGPVRSVQSARTSALLAGDAAHLLSTRALLRAGFSPETTVQALQIITEKNLEVVGGELVDVLFSLHLPSIHVTADRVLKMYRYKTAAYSFELPMLLGNLFATGTIKDRSSVVRCAVPLGVAYQLKDDLTGMFGTTEIGKTRYGDVKEGKQTILYCVACEMLEGSEHDTFTALYGKRGITEDQLEEVVRLLEKSGAQQVVEEAVQQCLGRALHSMSQLGLSEEAEELCKNLVRTIGSIEYGKL